MATPGVPDVDNQTPPPIPGPKPLSVFGEDYKPWESIDPSYSREQWQAWEPSRDPSCPADRPYKAERTDASGNPITECVEKPVDCPPGQAAFGDSQCLPLSDPRMRGGSGGGPGGGGGGGGGGGPMGGTLGALFGPGSPGFDTEQMIQSELDKIIKGHTRFGPEVMAALQGNSKAVEQARIKRETEAARESQAARGVAFSPLGAAQESDIRAQAASEFDQAVRTQQIQKAVTDFEDKMQALGNAQTWLNSLRSYALGLDSNNVQREGIQANIMIARERMGAEMEQLMAQIAANKDLQSAQIDFQSWLQYQRDILCINYGQC